MMNEFALTFRLCSPLALHRSRARAQYVETLDSIPGSALRGALAEAYLAGRSRVDDTFRDLFLSGKVYYGDLWPTVENKPTILIPVTGQACKRFHLKHRESFHDTLLDALAPAGGSRKCRDCAESCDRVSGYLSDLSPVEAVSARAVFRVSTAIERGTGAVAREMLFTQHTLIGKQRTKNTAAISGNGAAPPAHTQTDRQVTEDNERDILFRGRLWVADPNLQAGLDRLLAVGTRMRLGAGRSRGLGEVAVEAWQQAVPHVPLQERWRKFNEAALRAGGSASSRYFSLTLLSHLAQRDDLLCPILENISPKHLGLPADVEWVRYPSGHTVRFLATATVPGWNTAQGLPKPDTVALARGSVLLGRCQVAQEQAVLTRLAQIEAEGIGERRDEGFGRIAACYPIHYERWEVNR